MSYVFEPEDPGKYRKYRKDVRGHRDAAAPDRAARVFSVRESVKESGNGLLAAARM